MLRDKNVGATVAVRDLAAAKQFYGDILGLEVAESMEPGGITYRSGKSTIFVYVSEYAGTNEATAATWDVGREVDQIVTQLQGKGVKFEHYDLPDTKREGAIHISGNLRLAWLKDPDGNILALAGTT